MDYVYLDSDILIIDTDSDILQACRMGIVCKNANFCGSETDSAEREEEKSQWGKKIGGY